MKSLPLSLLSLILFSGLLLLLKVMSLGVRISDTNIYFYTGQKLLEGNLLYRDIFFTNFPLLPYVSALYGFLLGGNLTLFYLTATLEVIATSFLIYVIVLREWQNRTLAFTSSLLYLFSFIVLATSDHQTGVFLASLFAVLSYFFFQRKRLLLSGVFIGLAFMTKAYFLPIVASYVFYLLLKNRSMLIPFLLGTAGTVLLVLLPSLLLAPAELFHNVFSYSLTRTQGISKLEIFWFILRQDFLLLMILLFSLIQIRRQLFFGLVSLTSILFFLFYKDTYYLYLNVAVPFICLSLPYFITSLTRTFALQKMVIPSLVILFLVYTTTAYLLGYRDLQKVPNIDTMVQRIKQENPSALYGVNGLTPALAYLSDTPLLNKIVDTNETIFRKGYLKAEDLTEKAIKQHALVVTTGVYYPEFGIDQPVMTEIVNTETMLKSCQQVESFPVRAEGYTNRINLFAC